MPTFPTLTTGAILQYPSVKRFSYSTRVMTFLDGSEQRFRQYPVQVQFWLVKLDKLTEDEVHKVETFIGMQLTQSAPFLFTDPWDGVEHPDCTIASDDFESAFDLNGRGSLSLVIRNNGG